MAWEMMSGRRKKKRSKNPKSCRGPRKKCYFKMKISVIIYLIFRSFSFFEVFNII